MVNTGGFNPKTPSARREGHFCSFPAAFAFRSVSPESRNTVVFYPQKSCAFSKTYVSSSIYGVVPHGLAQGRTATGEKLSSGGISG
jgi:hypothetical protein